MRGSITEEIAEELQISSQELIKEGTVAYLERELRLAEQDIANLRDRYGVLSPQQLEPLIIDKEVSSHPAWEDLIAWENTLHHVEKIKKLLRRMQTKVA